MLTTRATRFLGLGKVGAKEKWIHALQMKAGAELSEEEKNAEPPGTTGCPYGTEVNSKPSALNVPPAKRARVDPMAKEVS